MFSNLPTYSNISGWVGGTFRWGDDPPNLGSVISYLLPIIFVAAGIGLFIYLLIGGFKLLTSAGNPKSVAAGGQILTNAVIGFLIVISSYWIAQIIQVVFNVRILGP